MVRIIKLIAEVVNDFHDGLNRIFKVVAPSLTDKDLHFWIMGIFGIIIYIVVNEVFKRLAKWSIEVISWIYTMTVLIVIVFAIEIQQKITNRGVMDFEDILAGLMGFIVMFAVYIVIKIIYLFIRHIYKKVTKKEDKVREDI